MRHPPSRVIPGRLVAAVLAGAAVALHAVTAYAAPATPTTPPAGPSDLNGLLHGIQAWIWGFAGLAAVVMLSIIALMYMVSGGHPGTVMKAKNGLRHVIIGLAILVLAPTIVNIVITVAGG